MPSKSQAQSRLMAAAAHSPGGYGGVPQSVGREFNEADTGKKRSALPVHVKHLKKRGLISDRALEKAVAAKKRIKGYALGGNPPVGQPAVVGENGPEVIVPRSRSTIVPNQRTALAESAQGGGSGGNGRKQLPFDPAVEQNLKTWGLTNDPGARSEAYKRHTPKDE